MKRNRRVEKATLRVTMPFLTKQVTLKKIRMSLMLVKRKEIEKSDSPK
jgi:hypothetical protein